MKTHMLCILPAYLFTLLIALVVPAQADYPATQSRLDALQAKVASLANDGAAGQVKAVLTIALERVKACAEANDAEDAKTWLNDAEAMLVKNPEAMTTPNTDTKTLTLMAPPKVVDGNPYLQRMVEGAKAELAKPEHPWAKNTPEVNTFNGLSGEAGSRSTGEEMEGWLWLFANPASPLKGHAEVLERYLRLAHAYADALDVHGTEQGQTEVAATKDSGPKAGQGIFDDFAIAPASNALREFAQLYPGLLLPSQKAQWDRAMANGARVMFGKAKDRQGTYANIDITLAWELLNFGLYLNNQEYLDKAKFLVEVQDKNIYPDGAIAYIGSQNESCTYHDADVHYLARYYMGTGNEKVADMLRKTEWYGPVSDARLCEFWTTPSWKDTWNSNRVYCGGEEVASLTGNPYLRMMNDQELARSVGPGTGAHSGDWAHNYAPLPWYRNDVKPLPLPDNYVVIDRNIQGPRAWYGRFNYACTTRSTPDTEAGLRTMMGVQMTQADFQIGQIAMDIYPRVRFNANDLNKDGTSFNRAAFASRMSGIKSAVVIGRLFSAVAGRYDLQEYRSSSPGNQVDWAGKQLWLGLPDRAIGLVEIDATKDGAKGMDVEGIVRLGTGGTVNAPATKIEEVGKDIWKYGDLTVSILDHNYKLIETPEVPFRLPKFPNTEIRLLDENGAAGSTSVVTYPASTHLFYLVEIRPSSVNEAAKASVFELSPGLQGMDVTVGAKHYLLAANLTEGELSYPIPAGFTGGKVSLHKTDGTVNRDVPAEGKLKPQELQVLVNSSETDDALPAWENYQVMVAALAKKN